MTAQRHFSFDKLLVLPLALLLTLLQALSPFVHAHYGNSFEHGWHMHLLPSRTLQPAAEHRAATDAAGHHYTQSLSTDESAEVDMEQGLPPDDSNAIALPATMWVVLAIVLCVWHVLVLPPRRARCAAALIPRSRPPHASPPALAPPCPF